ncbi:MAG: prepilin-type N-terminal cleavage/methylation domain-containing protein [Patescibacteria group bacterium]
MKPLKKIAAVVAERDFRSKKARRVISAFTLAELIVVVAILAVLASVGFMALSGYVKDAADARSKMNVRSVYAAI